MTVLTGGNVAPTEDDIAKVIESANLKVSENSPCYSFKIQRQQADELYGGAIYDKLEVS
jgi:hypothetical protein